MENFYLILVVILFALAISDLIVGVSNDAVNFLNSALGSKVAPRYVIMIIASVGIVVGTTFSSGMMEVARKGIFHPDQFVFAEIMIIFLAVMFTDIMLLDVFNTFGLPTSTTVSIVFEILGAAVAISLIKISSLGQDAGTLSQYINSASALAIITGILLSVFIAFSVGAIIQYITRFLFTFNYKRTYKYFGALWGGFAITAITYFILIKGAKGSSFITPENLEWIKANTMLIITGSFVGWTLILQVFYWLFKLDSLKIIVLVGTFALAMAFAGNDLVNFIGVPLAGLKSFQVFQATPDADPSTLAMTALTAKVKSNTYLLLIAGLIMVITLWLSKKARSVTETEINLSRQSTGAERFGSTMFSRTLVRRAINISKTVDRITSPRVKRFIEKRFNPEDYERLVRNRKDAPSFDLVRASVNLTVASVLIAFATSLKLPLSTTYVTFMVAMGSSLSDKAWGRESAVYRITGVITVIGGWFFTALTAFTVSFIIASIIHFGGIIAISVFAIIALLFIIKTHALHKKRLSKQAAEKTMAEEELGEENIHQRCSSEVNRMLDSVIKVYNETIIGISKEDRKNLKKVCDLVEELNHEAKHLKNNVHNTLMQLQEDSAETGHYYVQVIDYLREMAHSLTFISNPSYEHIDNNHKPLIEEQIVELNKLKEEITLLFTQTMHTIEFNEFDNVDNIINKQMEIFDIIKEDRKTQIKRIKKKDTGTRNSILYLGLLNESKNLLLHTINLLKSQRDFATSRGISTPDIPEQI